MTRWYSTHWRSKPFELNNRRPISVAMDKYLTAKKKKLTISGSRLRSWSSRSGPISTPCLVCLGHRRSPTVTCYHQRVPNNDQSHAWASLHHLHWLLALLASAGYLADHGKDPKIIVLCHLVGDTHQRRVHCQSEARHEWSGRSFDDQPGRGIDTHPRASGATGQRLGCGFVVASWQHTSDTMILAQTIDVKTPMSQTDLTAWGFLFRRAECVQAYTRSNVAYFTATWKPNRKPNPVTCNTC